MSALRNFDRMPPLINVTMEGWAQIRASPALVVMQRVLNTLVGDDYIAYLDSCHEKYRDKRNDDPPQGVQTDDGYRWLRLYQFVVGSSVLGLLIPMQDKTGVFDRHCVLMHKSDSEVPTTYDVERILDRFAHEVDD